MGQTTEGGPWFGDIGGMPQKAKESQVLMLHAARLGDDDVRKEWYVFQETFWTEYK